MNLNNDIAERLRQLRKELNFTQLNMALKLGFNGQSGYSSIESGKNMISEATLIIMEKTFNVNREWLLKGEGEMFFKESTTLLNEPELNYKNLSPMDRRFSILERDIELLKEQLVQQTRVIRELKYQIREIKDTQKAKKKEK